MERETTQIAVDLIAQALEHGLGQTMELEMDKAALKASLVKELRPLYSIRILCMHLHVLW